MSAAIRTPWRSTFDVDRGPTTLAAAQGGGVSAAPGRQGRSVAEFRGMKQSGRIGAAISRDSGQDCRVTPSDAGEAVEEASLMKLARMDKKATAARF